ncbi:MAG: SAM-dependent chlorinase/fluorinase [Euryarchaeota archaeon]|nr:SAM-dependent chlorinase/fluorinase [Euryarchaeota archaeon]
MITLTTDFGWSEYVGAMKGVILSIAPEARIVDITHSIRSYDIRHGAYVVGSVCRRFPEGSIHVVVVDPGVGTRRRGVVIEAGGHTYVGPDNGLFTFLKDVRRVIELQVEAASRTFHGRDVFAPVAAAIAKGRKPEEFGRVVEPQPVRLEIQEPRRRGRWIEGEVLCVDTFGNVITNIPEEMLDAEFGAELEVELSLRRVRVPFLESYGFAEPGRLLALIGSEGYLELAVNQGNAGSMLGVRGGERLRLCVVS